MADDSTPQEPASGPAGGKPLRILHSRVNIAGIGRYLADWQRKQGAVSDFVVYTDPTPHQNHHLNLHMDRKWLPVRMLAKLKFTLSCLRRYDVFNFYFGGTLLPFNLDLPLLKLFGKTVVMTYCGSDIRLYEVEKERNPYAALLATGRMSPRYDRRKKLMMRWQHHFVDRFIAARNIYASAIRVIPARKVERDIQVNNTMDLEAYKPHEYRTKEVPLLVHAPTSPALKGTAFIEETMERLRAQGLKFEYRRLQGVSSAEAHRIYKDDADIVVDQLLVGGFGTLAVEAMYYGKPVCCYLIDEVLEWFPDCPIVNCNVDNLAEKLVWLIQHPEERIRLGIEGRKFVEKHFDREAVNRRLWQMYQELLAKRRR